MKYLVLLSVWLIAIGCSQKPQESTDGQGAPAFNEVDLRSKWVQLTEREGKMVIFEPCEAENFHLEWKGDTLIIGYGQDASLDLISRIASENNRYLLEGTDIYSKTSNHKFRVEPVDSMPGLSRWWIMDDQEPRLLVKESAKGKYPVIKESCEGILEGDPK